jgi:hypothetical protein
MTLSRNRNDKAPRACAIWPLGFNRLIDRRIPDYSLAGPPPFPLPLKAHPSAPLATEFILDLTDFIDAQREGAIWAVDLIDMALAPEAPGGAERPADFLQKRIGGAPARARGGWRSSAWPRCDCPSGRRGNGVRADKPPCGGRAALHLSSLDCAPAAAGRG